RLLRGAAQTGAEGADGPRTAQPGPPSAVVWKFIQRYQILNPSVDTTSLGDIVMPPNGLHAMIVWRARDTSANAVGSFGGMQVAVQGGAIDTAAHYNWSEGSTTTAVVSAGGANNVVNVSPIVTSGGGDGSAASNLAFNSGAIEFPFYSISGINVTFNWRVGQSNPGNQISRFGTGIYWFASGPITKVHFFSGAGNFASGTSFDLFIAIALS